VVVEKVPLRGSCCGVYCAAAVALWQDELVECREGVKVVKG